MEINVISGSSSSTKLSCLVAEAHRGKLLAQVHCVMVPRHESNRVTYESQVRSPTNMVQLRFVNSLLND